MAKQATKTKINREQWLNKVKDHKIIKALFKAAGFPIPKNVRVSVGWPLGRGRSKKNQTIGQVFGTTCSKDKHFEIFISPSLAKSNRVADVLVHELVHAAVGLKQGHGKVFRKCALAVGLTGKMTATLASDELNAKLDKIVKQIGPFPHAKLTARSKIKSSGPKTQGTRMKKVHCPACGYTLRTTKKWLAVGLPTCCCGTEMVSDDAPKPEPDHHHARLLISSTIDNVSVGDVITLMQSNHPHTAKRLHDPRVIAEGLTVTDIYTVKDENRLEIVAQDGESDKYFVTIVTDTSGVTDRCSMTVDRMDSNGEATNVPYCESRSTVETLDKPAPKPTTKAVRYLRNGAKVGDHITLRVAYAATADKIEGGLRLMYSPLVVAEVNECGNAHHPNQIQVVARTASHTYWFNLLQGFESRSGHTIQATRQKGHGPYNPRCHGSNKGKSIGGVRMVTLEEFSTVESPDNV